jgi:hypothetical protein
MVQFSVFQSTSLLAKIRVEVRKKIKGMLTICALFMRGVTRVSQLSHFVQGAKRSEE